MDRNEAVLRELNLYPLWQRRGEPAPVAAEQAALVATAQDVQGAQASGYATLTRPTQPGITVAGPVVVPVAPPVIAEPQCAALAAAENGEQGREQLVGELDWPPLKAMVRDCTACKLRAGCTQTVFGVGDEQAEWLFVGEGPGADEDAQGEPFVGQAGKLLDNMLLAIGLARGKNVYIANIVKCRPPGNRTPEADEIASCLPYLQRQIELIEPRLIVALGKTAATVLLGREASLGSLRGALQHYRGIPLIITYHPAYLLRSPMEKAKAWQDLRLAVLTSGRQLSR